MDTSGRVRRGVTDDSRNELGRKRLLSVFGQWGLYRLIILLVYMIQGCIWYRIIRVGKPSMPMNQWWLMNWSKISKAEWTGNHGLYHHFFLWGSLVWFREPRWKFYHGGTVVMMTTRRARGWRWRWRLGDCYFDDADSDNDSGFIWVYKII